MDFRLLDWSAWADGLASPQDWHAWARRSAGVPQVGAAPNLPDVPAMTRRRLGRLGRICFEVARRVHTGAPELPVVLASRYGDAERALEQLGLLVGPEGALSPTGFGLSVHNAIGAIHSIATGSRANVTAVAAAGETAAAGLTEAACLLEDGVPEVVLVCYDEDLPAAYARFQDGPIGAWAWAWRIGRADDAHERLSLVAGQPSDGGGLQAGSLPDGLDVLRFVLSGDSRLEQRHAGRSWIWGRHAASH
ncbi:beta-ketoacyl synthase chain length factor [Caldimonas sp. KR1-144]|uniref:beta-ketoacyl synthase chain length factor n=1 Tax=Caldimonas sp. KR1-144 TaxID=3400911 RepID=UPI003C0264CB